MAEERKDPRETADFEERIGIAITKAFHLVMKVNRHDEFLQRNKSGAIMNSGLFSFIMGCLHEANGYLSPASETIETFAGLPESRQQVYLKKHASIEGK